jgi:biopolymer transport protein ExbB
MVAAAAVVTLAAHAADGFAPGDWKHKLKTVIDTTAEGVELKQGASQVPIALRLHTGNFAFAEAKPDGSDLRVVAGDGKTPLRFHLEKYDSASELAVLWVQQPKLAPAAKADAIVLLWGNEKAAPAGDVKATYDAAQTLVLHFSDVGPVRDATGNAHHPRDFTAQAVPGPLGNAASLDGKSVLTIPASPSLKLISANGFSFSAWIKPADAQTGALLQHTEGAKGLAVTIKAGKLAAVANGKELPSQATLQPGVWQHVAVTLIGGKLSFYLNGAEAGGGEVSVADSAGDVLIGAGFRGEIDEVTLAATARSADYIKALHGSQQPDSPMLVAAAEEEGGGESASYIGILLGALTVDGWVVIGILAVMGVVSVFVMIGKTLFLGRTNKANDAFIKRFRDDSRKLLRPDSLDTKEITSNEAVRHSTIFRLYKIGIEEMRHRFEAQNEGGKEHSLSGAALNAIRAAMDAAMVRENQRLNSQIVLLTIAISGGPFLGLLGTVVGVMITFAAIAAAGDVNVNSIAPGIAAALVATVAGLAVAIPALFGYNWLAIQIKNVSADTQVFADQFLTEAAELYSA